MPFVIVSNLMATDANAKYFAKLHVCEMEEPSSESEGFTFPPLTFVQLR